jgi:hypothetical protein
LFRKRIGGDVVVVVVRDSLGEHAKKNSFHTRKKLCFSMTTRVRPWLAYFVFDFSISHGAWGKENKHI